MSRFGADGIDTTTLELAEELCGRFQLETGLARLELMLLNGSFQFAWRDERVQLARLAEAYEPSRQTTR